MKYLLFVFCLTIITPLILNAQQKSSEEKVVFKTQYLIKDALYVGLDNILTIQTPSLSTDKIVASITGNGSIKAAEEKGKYIVNVKYDKDEANTVRIKVARELEDQTADYVGSKVFRVKSVPKPIVHFGSVNNGFLASEELQNVDKLTIKMDSFINNLYTILRYEFIYVTQDAGAIVIKADGSEITEKMKGYFKTAKEGDEIIFSNIYAEVIGIGEQRMPSGIRLKIK